MDGPFGSSKFVVRRAAPAAGSEYYALSTNITAEAVAVGATGARNNLVLSTSRDLRSWRVCRTLLADDTGFSVADSARYTGFEYPDWKFDGADIVAGVRIAYRGAASGKSVMNAIACKHAITQIRLTGCVCRHESMGRSGGSSNRMTVLRVVGYAAACGN